MTACILLWHLGDLGTQVLILLGVLQKVDELHDLQLGLLAPRHVFELDVDLVAQHLGGGLAHAEQTTHPPTGAASCRGAPTQGEQQEGDDQHGGKHAEKERAAKGRLLI